MKTDSNLLLMMRYNQLWSLAQLEHAGEVLAGHFTRHGSSGRFQGIPAFQRYVRHFLLAFPDARFTPREWISEPDKVIVRYQFSGTHQDEFVGIPPTGKLVSADGMSIYRIGNGRIEELWDFLDMLSFVSGALPFVLKADL